mmetsp:Transcript_10758/g.18828  ORF Transcript_10758/g.18828 Transcript_10758/m.18828 type:complete len:239 (+) Transcript_10758:117-833(+)
MVLLHGRVGAHAIKLLEPLPVDRDHLAAALVMAGQHPSHHDEICTGPKSLCNVASACASTIRYDVTAEPMGGICAFDHGTELRIADTRHLSGRAHGARPDADLDNIGATEDQLLCHLPCHDVAGDESMGRELLPHRADKLDKVLGVAVGDIQAYHVALGNLDDLRELLQVVGSHARANRHILDVILSTSLEPRRPVLWTVVLVNGGHHLFRPKHLGNLERPNGIHVGGEQGHTSPYCF